MRANASSIHPMASDSVQDCRRCSKDSQRSSLAVDVTKRFQLMTSSDAAPKRNQRKGRRTTVACLPQGSETFLLENEPDVDRSHHHSLTELSTFGIYREPRHKTSNGSRVRTRSSDEIFLEDVQDEDLEPSSFPSPSAPLRDNEEMSTLYFRDGVRKIDFVLAFQDSDYRRNEFRKMFQENLRKAGLEIELEDKSLSQDGKTYFLKIHAPYSILRKHAEVLNIKRPIKGEDFKPVKEKGLSSFFLGSFKDLFSYDRTLIPDDIDKNDVIHGSTTNGIIRPDIINYTDAQRSRIVWEILIRTPHHGDGRASTGVLYLVSNGTYTAAYPLHDGPYGKGAFKREEEEPNARRLLYSEWARAACWYKRQPLGLIRRYFGEKTSLYFAWLGFYTTMLIPAAFLGLLTMIYGVSTMNSNIPSKEICDEQGPGEFVMCPQCNRRCDYWRLKEGCLFSKIVHLFDNAVTVGFAVFMSLWATMFMEFWKRKQATLAWEWNLADLDYGMEQIRPEYESTVKNYRLNPVTMAIEPFLPFWSKVYRIAAANSAVLFVLSLLLGTVFGMIVYRIILVTVLTASDHPIWQPYAKITTSITASLLNLVVIVIMDKVYRELTAKLTDLEQPRTQREYEDSFTFKMFLFEFINMYSSLIYIAFFKGRFFGHPGHTFTLFGFRQDQCELGGCLFEVCVQLAIIMVGKQILNNISELSWAEMMNWWKRWWRTRDGPKDRKATTRWEIDYNLLECDRMALFDEYLEMVIQFGFVTLFVAAFPLAPLFALLNNIVEIRLDAYKYVTQLRRPLSARVPNIGAWQTILKGLSVFAVISNAFMIAYTSDFIPRLVYIFVTSKDQTLNGYINNSLSYFDPEDFTDDTRPMNSSLNETGLMCRYQDYRNPPNDPEEYQLNMKYWHIFAARLSFVVVFEHLVFFVTSILAYMIPDIPKSVQQKIMRKRYLAREALYKTEAEEARTVLEGSVDGDNAALPC
ncbi:anoctamin-5-like isoform X2 [Stegodyphus dumicola]|uniref:anoctamin-5-like isoform X2 n=1 Tax=Stegodyphus dumicola TaxID=202533 RepID=UPI0015A8199D|nr:anoctamin-5-like isoform X2 [Stegodyphus dumicola]